SPTAPPEKQIESQFAANVSRVSPPFVAEGVKDALDLTAVVLQGVGEDRETVEGGIGVDTASQCDHRGREPRRIDDDGPERVSEHAPEPLATERARLSRKGTVPLAGGEGRGSARRPHGVTPPDVLGAVPPEPRGESGAVQPALGILLGGCDLVPVGPAERLVPAAACA